MTLWSVHFSLIFVDIVQLNSLISFLRTPRRFFVPILFQQVSPESFPAFVLTVRVPVFLQISNMYARIMALMAFVGK